MNKSFNPKARWDRHIPEDSDSAGQEPLAEIIEVLAWFKQGKIYPRLFTWNNKKYKVKRVTYNWQERRGQETINYFSVSTGSDLYQISFNAKTLGWRIDKII
ncbi:MAG: hypothetical protein PHN57_01060 [Candidatus Omnitrophica bacterium]|nr:hypothetical protein [Candidatus Omnitrophota bacterium]